MVQPAVGGIFGRQAIYLDRRQPFGIEYQRDASRGGGGWELNATMEYAYGVWRPTLGGTVEGNFNLNLNTMYEIG